ncbi:MAG: energy-converting hydrogenase B subunit EhbP [Candidatus Methanomethylicus sp.]|nr:energy-converting hydrogenase B subunit EhbP [Candidatus Methanomethylicus sp.]
MPKIAIREKHVINMGGWLCERKVNLPYRDIVIGNPFNEPVKIESPIYSLEAIEEMKKMGLIIEPVYTYDRLVDKLNKVKAIIQSIP